MATRQRSRWLRYSIRSLLIVILLISAGLAYFGNLASRNAQLVERARTVQAEIEFRTWAPDWACRWFGERYFREPVAIYVPQDLAVNCLPLLEDAPSVRTLGVIDYAFLGSGFDIAALRQAVQQCRDDVEVVEINATAQWASTRVRDYDDQTAEGQLLEKLLSEFSADWSSEPQVPAKYQVFRIELGDERLQLYLFFNNLILLADGDRLIDGLADYYFQASSSPTVQDTNQDGIADVGMWRNYGSGQYNPGQPYSSPLCAFRITPKGFVQFEKTELPAEYQSMFNGPLFYPR